jgi:hypothetical protein
MVGKEKKKREKKNSIEKNVFMGLKESNYGTKVIFWP